MKRKNSNKTKNGQSKSQIIDSTDKQTKTENNRDADIIDLAASDEPIRHLQGIKTVREALKLEDFPMTTSDIDYAVGDIDIEDGHGGYIPVYELTERFENSEFNTLEEVVIALKKARLGYKRSVA